MALFHSISLYFSLHSSTMAQLQATLLYISLPWLYLTILNSKFLYFTLLDYTILYHGSISLSLSIPLPWLYFTLLSSTLLYHGSSYFNVLHTKLLYHGSTLLYFPLLYSPFYIFLPWLYFIILCFTLLYHGSTSLYFTLHFSNMALYITLP